jgi:hypothetical protein
MDNTTEVERDAALQRYHLACINLAVHVDITDQLKHDPNTPGDRSPRAAQLRETHLAKDLAEYRAALNAWKAAQ